MKNDFSDSSNNKVLKIIKTKCPQNHKCPAVRKCPVKSLIQNDNNAPVLDEEKCIKCGKCIRLCPKGVFVLE